MLLFTQRAGQEMSPGQKTERLAQPWHDSSQSPGRAQSC